MDPVKCTLFISNSTIRNENNIVRMLRFLLVVSKWSNYISVWGLRLCKPTLGWVRNVRVWLMSGGLQGSVREVPSSLDLCFLVLGRIVWVVIVLDISLYVNYQNNSLWYLFPSVVCVFWCYLQVIPSSISNIH